MVKLKKFKFFVISIVFALIFGINYCYAVELNLTDDLTTNFSLNNTSDNSNSTDSNATNSTDTDTDSNTNITNTNSENTMNTTDSATYSGTSNTSTTVSNALPESNLGLSNILNIFIIVIGVLLVLLGIAILIRIKK